MEATIKPDPTPGQLPAPGTLVSARRRRKDGGRRVSTAVKWPLVLGGCALVMVIGAFVWAEKQSEAAAFDTSVNHLADAMLIEDGYDTNPYDNDVEANQTGPITLGVSGAALLGGIALWWIIRSAQTPPASVIPPAPDLRNGEH